MKHIFTALILWIGISTMVSGQIDTIQKIFEERIEEDLNSTNETDEIYIPNETDEIYIPNETNEIYTPDENGDLAYARMYASIDAAFSTTKNSLFFPESYNANGMHLSVGCEVNNTQAFRFFDMGFVIPFRTPSFSYRELGVDYPGNLSVKKSHFYVDYGYLRNLGSHRHAMGAKFGLNMLGSTFWEDNVSEPRLFYDQVAIELGPSYMFQTSSKPGLALKARIDLPLLAHYGDVGWDRNWAGYRFLGDWGTLNKYIAPDLKLEMLLNGKNHRPVISLYYQGNYQHNRYAKDMTWAKDYSHTIGTKVYFGNYEALLGTLYVILSVLGGG